MIAGEPVTAPARERGGKQRSARLTHQRDEEMYIVEAQQAEAEQQVLARAPQASLVRTSLIYGVDADDSQDLHTQFVLNGLRQQRAVTLFSDEYRCPIFVGDLARALLELLTIQQHGLLHIVGAERLSRYEFGVLLARYHGYRDLQPLISTTTISTGIVRPLDCTLRIDTARALLTTALRGAGAVLRF